MNYNQTVVYCSRYDHQLSGSILCLHRRSTMSWRWSD